jgi:hypothetical protein
LHLLPNISAEQGGTEPNLPRNTERPGGTAHLTVSGIRLLMLPVKGNGTKNINAGARNVATGIRKRSTFTVFVVSFDDDAILDPAPLWQPN